MRVVVAVASIFVLCCGAVAADDRIEEIVRANFPQDLLSSEEYGGDVRLSPHHVVDLDGDPSSKEIVVAYADAAAGLLCAITSVETSPQRICAEYQFTGTNPALELIDLESDGSTEFGVSFTSTGNGARYLWLYRWEGNGWKGLTSPEEPFKDPLLIDLDGDGDLDILDGARFGSDVQSTYLWAENAFEGGTADVFDWITAIRTQGPPTRVEQSISIPPGRSGSYRLRVVPDRNVSSATIRIDDKVVFGPSAFRPGTLVLLSDPVVLNEHSILNVELNGKPGARLLVVVEGD